MKNVYRLIMSTVYRPPQLLYYISSFVFCGKKMSCRFGVTDGWVNIDSISCLFKLSLQDAALLSPVNVSCFEDFRHFYLTKDKQDTKLNSFLERERVQSWPQGALHPCWACTIITKFKNFSFHSAQRSTWSQENIASRAGFE